MSFPDDHLLHILLGYVYASQDYHSLAQCALVNHEFNGVASRLLYSRVVHSPPLGRGLNLPYKAEIGISMFSSSSLPKYAKYVRVLEMTGHLSPRPLLSNAFSSILSRALLSFVNLNRVVFNPVLCHEDVFIESLKMLASFKSESELHAVSNEVEKERKKTDKGLEVLEEEDEDEDNGSDAITSVQPESHSQTLPPEPFKCLDVQLQSLVVGSACVHEKCAPILVRINGLEGLTIYNPSRALLNLLPEWLAQLKDSLTSLHLKNNCGSITPGVLQAILPHVAANLKAFTLGLSYSLVDENVWNFLSRLESLELLQLRYYFQYKQPKLSPHISNLTTFMVEYTPIQMRAETDKLCKWIRRTTSASPALQHLRLTCLDSDEDLPFESDIEGTIGFLPFWQDRNWTQNRSGSNPSFDSLIWHLVGSCGLSRETIGTVSVKGRMLKTLDMRSSFIGYRALENLLRACLELEEVFLCVGRDGLRIFVNHGAGLTNLHTALFNIRNVKKSKTRLTVEKVTEIMQRSPKALRRLAINGVKWERSFEGCTSSEIGSLELKEVIREIQSKLPPWLGR